MEKLKEYRVTADILEKEVFSNSSNTEVPIQIRCSHHLMTDATREIFLDGDLNIKKIYIVLKSDLIQYVNKAYKKVSKSTKDDRLGILWELVKPLLHKLGHSNLPRDRFFEEIHRVWCDCVAMRNIFFSKKRKKRLPKVIIQEYLDDEYLRPSLAEIMSGIPDAYRPMEVTWKKKGKPIQLPFIAFIFDNS